jgi:hypothetical protein
MALDTAEKNHYLHKAIEIAIAACASTSNPDLLAQIIEKTYNKMIEISEKN